MTNTKNLAFAGLFLAVGVLLPRVFHFAGPDAGKIFLPLFWGVATAALCLPLKFAVGVGLLTPIISYLTSAMPSIPLLYFMIFELICYATAIHFIKNKLNPYLTILASMIISRLMYMASALIMANLFGITLPFAVPSALFATITLSFPGILAQVLFIPLINATLQRITGYESTTY